PIDRYQPEPRPRGDDHYSGRERDERRRLPSPVPANIDRYVPGQDTGKPVSTVNPITDPSKLSFQVGFSYFGEWWRKNEQIKEEKERQRVGARRPPERVKGEKEARE